MPKSQMEVGCPGTQGLQLQSQPQGRRDPSDQYNLQPSQEPPAQALIAPVIQKPKGPVEINNPKKKDNNNTTADNNTNKYNDS